MNDAISRQVEELKQHYPDAEIKACPDGTFVITLALKTCPEGAWNKERTRVWFVVPVGYPVAKPDCFWAEPDLRLGNNAMPMNTNFNPMPSNPGQYLWFSWHANKWNPNRDNLLTYVHTVESRLRVPR